MLIRTGHRTAGPEDHSNRRSPDEDIGAIVIQRKTHKERQKGTEICPDQQWPYSRRHPGLYLPLVGGFQLKTKRILANPHAILLCWRGKSFV